VPFQQRHWSRSICEACFEVTYPDGRKFTCALGGHRNEWAYLAKLIAHNSDKPQNQMAQGVFYG
jgi:hypothetical protein